MRTVPLITADPAVQTRRVQYDHELTYPDVPGAHQATKDAMTQALQEAIAEQFGEAAAERALGHVVWTVKPPRWAGDRAAMSARLTAAFQHGARGDR